MDDQLGTEALASTIEVWAGVECTVNRVRELVFDQMKKGGHFDRADDIHLIKQLDVQAVRYPVLWEHAQHNADVIDLQWAARRLALLNEARIPVIAGLVHHGAGPSWTSLCDADFPFLLARYAAEVARRFPWLEDFTPVNEPVTTARFSGLYGHWHPHGRSDELFVRILLNECRATVLAIQQIRRFCPQARLIQTEDAGYVHSVPKLRYQAAFENERRWLSFDLLCGRMDSEHYLWKYLVRSGATPDELRWFESQNVRPAILGLNYYITSERYLDHAVDRYPEYLRGNNGRHCYADVEAIRIPLENQVGIDKRLMETHERYRLPIAVTECHLGCHRESQLHWIKEIWNSASDAVEQGIDVRAVTSWSIFGSHNWNSLVTEDNDHYESGAFDVRSVPPRPTAVAHLVARLRSDDPFDHPVFAMTPWWQRESRFFHPIEAASSALAERHHPDMRPLLVVGAATLIGKAFIRACSRRGIPYLAIEDASFDRDTLTKILAAILEFRPWGLINAYRHNAKKLIRCSQSDETIAALVKLCEICTESDTPLVTFSSDDVFDGTKSGPYNESDMPRPICDNGRFQRLYDEIVQAAAPRALTIRTGPLIMPGESDDFLTGFLTSLSRGAITSVPTDWIVSPTYLPDAANCCLDLLIDEERGVWHLANRGHANWKNIATMAAIASGLEPRLLADCSASVFWPHFTSPRQSALCSERANLLPTLEESLNRFARAIQSRDAYEVNLSPDFALDD